MGLLTALLPLLAHPITAQAQDARPEPTASLERRLAELVSDERAARTVREMVALGPRMGGTPSGERAAEWRAKTYGAMGLEVEVIEDPETWAHWEPSWSVEVVSGLGEVGACLESAWPYGYSPSVNLRAPLSLEPTEGAIWLSPGPSRARRGSPEPALILVDGASTPDGRYPKVRSLRAGDRNRTAVMGIGSEDGSRLREALSEGHVVEIEVALESHIQRASPRTVVARLPAREGARSGHLLFSAHGDSDAGGPGANDNASGEAIVREIASAWTEAIREGLLAPPEREVRFAIWGSEIHSTRAYLDANQTGSSPVLAVINFDQAGFGSGAEQLNIEPDDLAANAPMIRLAAAVLSDHAGTVGFPEQWATNKSLGGTDSYVFSGSRVFRDELRPSVTLFTSAWDKPDEHPRTEGMPGESWRDRPKVRVDHDDFYHSAGDIPENTTDLEPHNMGWCARVGLLTGLRWLAGESSR